MPLKNRKRGGLVNHHTGGLEIPPYLLHLLHRVNHHTGGLEKLEWVAAI